MSGTTDYRAFLDKTGLTYFWRKIREYLAVPGQSVPAGKQISKISQHDGKISVEFSEFGGNTEEEKAAARESLGVISAEELEKKADKVSPTPEEPILTGKVPILTDTGNLASSGVTLEQFKRIQEAWTESSDGKSTITSIGQNANGEVTVTFAPIPEALFDQESGTYSSGIMSAEDKERLDNTPSTEDVSRKADKCIPSSPDNIAVLDATGNLADSGVGVLRMRPFGTHELKFYRGAPQV